MPGWKWRAAALVDARTCSVCTRAAGAKVSGNFGRSARPLAPAELLLLRASLRAARRSGSQTVRSPDVCVFRVPNAQTAALPWSARIERHLPMIPGGQFEYRNRARAVQADDRRRLELSELTATITPDAVARGTDPWTHAAARSEHPVLNSDRGHCLSLDQVHAEQRRRLLPLSAQTSPVVPIALSAAAAGSVTRSQLPEYCEPSHTLAACATTACCGRASFHRVVRRDAREILRAIEAGLDDRHPTYSSLPNPRAPGPLLQFEGESAR
jgi:hypothetical protein